MALEVDIRGMFKSSQRGVSIFLALIVMIPLLAIAMGVSIILLSQLRTLKEQGHSVIAFYAADTGIEKVLVDREAPNLTPGYYDGSLDNGATYEVFVTEGGGTGCSIDFNYCIKSIGIYKSTRRAIEINY